MRHTTSVIGGILPSVAFILSWACAPQPQDTHPLVSRIDSVVEMFLEKGEAPSYAVGIRLGEDFVFTRGYGLADLEHQVSATHQSVYRIASLTKQFTATAVLQLVERGLIGLEDDVREYLPDLSTRGHHVTIHHLLTHTSGVPSYTGLSAFEERVRLDLSHDALVDLIEEEPFDFLPGEALRYSNSGYYLLGMIIEAVSGQSYAEYLEEHIFRPLGMERSAYCSVEAIVPNRAKGYSREDQEWSNAEAISMVNPFAAGGVCSTVGDLLKWQNALSQHLILNEDSSRKMTQRATLNDGSETPYGYGIVITEFDGYQKYAFRGGITGFGSALTFTPELGLTIAVLTNSDQADPVELEVTLARMIAEWTTGET
ncbi:MAG: beta-lactamase family protein [Gemmatimonadota bacterium]|nr:MAG: beta-lactamase family protein [Gemmatimonadota bacterium]